MLRTIVPFAVAVSYTLLPSDVRRGREWFLERVHGWLDPLATGDGKIASGEASEVSEAELAKLTPETVIEIAESLWTEAKAAAEPESLYYKIVLTTLAVMVAFSENLDVVGLGAMAILPGVGRYALGHFDPGAKPLWGKIRQAKAIAVALLVIGLLVALLGKQA